MSRVLKPVLILAIVATGMVWSSATTTAVRPVIVMFYGGGLTESVFVKDTMIFHELANPTSLKAADFSGRKYLDVAAFWGASWNPYYNGQKPLTELRPGLAGHHGRVYVATSSDPAARLPR